MTAAFFRRRARLALIPIAIVTLGMGSAAADPEDKLDTIQEKRERVHARRLAAEAQIEDILEEIAYLDAKRARAEARVDELDVELSALGFRIGIVSDRLTDAQRRLAVLTDELLDIQARLVDRTDAFTARAVAAYMAGPTAYFESLLSSTDFTDLVSRLAYHEAALDADAELISEITTLRDGTAAHRDAVESYKLAIARAKLALEQDYDALRTIRDRRADVLAAREEAVRQKDYLLAAIETRRDALAAAEAQLEQDAARIQGILQGGSTGAPHGNGQLLWPANGPVTSGYGYRTHPIFGDQRMHTGIDIGAGYGAPVWAADSGYVTYVGVMSGYGNVVVIDHGGGLATTYNHLSAFYVSSGESVGRGVQVAAVGCTGYCTGPHLHFEVRVNGEPVDPMPYLR